MLHAEAWEESRSEIDMARRQYNGVLTGEHLHRTAFPLGGIGAGMICLEGTGAISHVSVRNQPQVFNEPLTFAAICVKGRKTITRVLEGPVPGWKLLFPWGSGQASSGNGNRGKNYGLPHCRKAEMLPRFPFATVKLTDRKLPLAVEVTGWSPFIPGDADNSSLPAASIEYRFTNTSDKDVDAVYSFHAANFMSIWQKPGAGVLPAKGGFVLKQDATDEEPWCQGAFCAAVDDGDVRVNCAWFRGGWFDAQTMAWKTVERGEMVQAGPITEGDPSGGGSLYVPVQLAPGQSKTIRLMLSWYVPQSDLRNGKGVDDPDDVDASTCAAGTCCESAKPDIKDLPRHEPWYAERFEDVHAVNEYWQANYADLRSRSAAFRDAFYDTTLPGEVVEAIAANLTILKSPTVLRQRDGRLWAWEGCCDSWGCCSGSCTHVWNYAQALCHLFPDLERSFRQTEFNENQGPDGKQAFRATLPIRRQLPEWHAAADGQLGGIMKVYRELRISGDRAWLAEYWPKTRASLEYCIETWDPDRLGVLVEPHHNTYDIEFWGPDGMCSSFYLGALAAAVAMGREMGDDVSAFEDLLAKGKEYVESKLYNGKYFFQKVQWKNLRAAAPDVQAEGHWNTNYSPEAMELMQAEGPKYQYGKGCLSDGVLGDWMARVCGVGAVLDEAKVESHLQSVFKHNFRKDLSEHANPQRPTYAVGSEAGLLLCSWPKGGQPSLPFVYSNEVWTGIEYHVAAHLMMTGYVDEGLRIVRAVRDRYDGRVRNPFNEYECGHWYARAMSSYGMIQGLTGIRYDAVDKVLYVAPSLAGDWRAFLATAGGFGTVIVEGGRARLEVRSGSIEVERIEYTSKT